MPIIEAVHRYITALNAHDKAAIMDAMSPSGTYVDPLLDSPIGQEATGEYLNSFLDTFPDAHWDIVTVCATSETTAALEWRMTGTSNRTASASRRPVATSTRTTRRPIVSAPSRATSTC
jgi:hypothetical protein